jgi:hypothetical protein
MRQDRIQAGDTLQSIAIRNYYVYDDQGKLDQDRIRSVAGDLIKSNTNLLQFLPTQPHTQPPLNQIRWKLSGCNQPHLMPHRRRAAA